MSSPALDFSSIAFSMSFSEVCPSAKTIDCVINSLCSNAASLSASFAVA